VENLGRAWGDRRSAFQQAQQDYQNRQRIANLPGMSVRELYADSLDLTPGTPQWNDAIRDQGLEYAG